MTRDQILAHLQTWQQATAELDEQMDALAAIVGMQPESPLHEAVWKAWGHYTRTLAHLLDAADWLDWYYFECAMGGKAMEASPYAGAPLRPIDSLEALAQIITECNNPPGDQQP